MPSMEASDYNFPPRTTGRCQSAMLQGRRKSKRIALFAILTFTFRFLEALLRVIHDIDAAFTKDLKEASRRNIDSGSTATVVLIAEGQILVANIGDSKALLCSEKFQSPAEVKATLLRLYRKQRDNNAVPTLRGYNYFKSTISNGLAPFSVKELTRDHHPDGEDERFRVEAAGGYVLQSGSMSRVNGQLAVSRSIGDLSYKR